MKVELCVACGIGEATFPRCQIAFQTNASLNIKLQIATGIVQYDDRSRPCGNCHTNGQRVLLRRDGVDDRHQGTCRGTYGEVLANIDPTGTAN